MLQQQRVADIGTWALDSNELQNWKNNPSEEGRLLWVHGICKFASAIQFSGRGCPVLSLILHITVGSGKTMLA